MGWGLGPSPQLEPSQVSQLQMALDQALEGSGNPRSQALEQEG